MGGSQPDDQAVDKTTDGRLRPSVSRASHPRQKPSDQVFRTKDRLCRVGPTAESRTRQTRQRHPLGNHPTMPATRNP